MLQPKLLLSKLAILSTIFLFLNCGGAKKIQTFTTQEYASDKKASQIQTKSNVTIEAIPIAASKSYNFPELFSFKQTDIPDVIENSSIFFRDDYQGKKWCYTLGAGDNFLTAFKVKITNKTPHILRMKDTRIYLVIEGEDPIPAVTLLGNPILKNAGNNKDKYYLPESYINSDNSLIDWVTQMEVQWQKERPKGFIDFTYPIGLSSQVIKLHKKEYKLINDVNREILPDFSYEGILLFPVLVSFDKVKLIFYDITTKTDAAGTPIEKTKFEFSLRLDKVDMWYDDVKEKRWKIGTPPVKITSTKK